MALMLMLSLWELRAFYNRSVKLTKTKAASANSVAHLAHDNDDDDHGGDDDIDDVFRW